MPFPHECNKEKQVLKFAVLLYHGMQKLLCDSVRSVQLLLAARVRLADHVLLLTGRYAWPEPMSPGPRERRTAIPLAVDIVVNGRRQGRRAGDGYNYFGAYSIERARARHGRTCSRHNIIKYSII